MLHYTSQHCLSQFPIYWKMGQLGDDPPNAGNDSRKDIYTDVGQSEEDSCYD
jgi:hypothetical protein